MENENRTVTVEGVTLVARIVRKRVRNINVRLVGDELRVSAPHRVPRAELDEIMRTLAGRLVRRAREREVNADGAAVRVARRVASRFPTPPKVDDVRFVTNQRARWGSYSVRTGTVRLSAALRHMPGWVLEAVVAHELAHAFHADHSRMFWELVRSVCPTTDRARAFLDGVTWLADHADDLPPVERSQLVRSQAQVRAPGCRVPSSKSRQTGVGALSSNPAGPVDRALPFDSETR
jgi:predicted metal-dependent hydrolase